MKRQQAEETLNRFFEECGDAGLAQNEIEPVLDRVWERLESRADEFVSARLPAEPVRPFPFVWATGILLVAVLVNVVVWRHGPPLPRAVKTGNADEHSFSKSSSQQAGESLRLTVPRDAFELASVKLLPPSSEAAQTAKLFDEMQVRFPGLCSNYLQMARVDPGRLAIPAITVLSLVIVAYGHDCALVEGGPAWARSSEHYEIQALLPAGTPSYTRQDLEKGNAPELQRMLQSLLADRFRLVVKRELREMSVYTLTVATPGKMKLSPDETLPPPSVPIPPGFPPLQQISRGQKISLFLPGEDQMSGHAISMSELARDLRAHAGRVVVDKTGLTGVFDYDLRFAREIAPPFPAAAPPSPQPAPPLPGPSPVPPVPVPSAAAPSLRTALQDQLGLKLENAKIPIEVLVIVSVERPSEN